MRKNRKTRPKAAYEVEQADQGQWPYHWTEEERGELATPVAVDPSAGDVVTQSVGICNVRWSRSGGGKSGGVRAIYYTRLLSG
jgi:hypothetical protein